MKMERRPTGRRDGAEIDRKTAVGTPFYLIDAPSRKPALHPATSAEVRECT